MRVQQAEEATHAPTQPGDDAACSSCMLWRAGRCGCKQPGAGAQRRMRLAHRESRLSCTSPAAAATAKRWQVNSTCCPACRLALLSRLQVRRACTRRHRMCRPLLPGKQPAALHADAIKWVIHGWHPARVRECRCAAFAWGTVTSRLFAGQATDLLTLDLLGCCSPVADGCRTPASRNETAAAGQRPRRMQSGELHGAR